jgi:hypothetical protein
MTRSLLFAEIAAALYGAGLIFFFCNEPYAALLCGLAAVAFGLEAEAALR